MSKLHFEHGSTEGAIDNAYKTMLNESAATEKREAEEATMAKYNALVTKRNKLNESIKRFYKFNTELIEESLDEEFGKKGLNVMINSWIQGLEAGKVKEVIKHMKEIAK